MTQSCEASESSSLRGEGFLGESEPVRDLQQTPHTGDNLSRDAEQLLPLNLQPQSVSTRTEPVAYIDPRGQFNLRAGDSAQAEDQPADRGAELADGAVRALDESPNAVSEIREALSRLDNLSAGTIRRTADGRHAVQLRFNSPSTLPAVNFRHRGFRPGPSRVAENLSFTIGRTAQGFQLTEIHGLTGTVTGPLGRVRFTENTGMTIGRDSSGRPYVDSTTNVQMGRRLLGRGHRWRTSTVRLREENFPSGSPMRTLMQQPDVIQRVGDALNMFQGTDDLQQIRLSRATDGRLGISAEAKEPKEIRLNPPINILGSSIDSISLDRSLSATLSHRENEVRLENVRGITLNVSTLLGRVQMTPTAAAIRNGADGKPVLRLEMRNPSNNNQPIPIEIPVSALRRRAR